MDYQTPSQRRRYCRRLLVLGVCVLILMTVVGVCIGVAFSDRKGPIEPSDLRAVIVPKCKGFLKENGKHSSEKQCEEVWDAFSRAYVGRDPCDVPMEAYDPLIQTVSQKDTCNRTLFWSETKDIAHQLTEAKKCLVTLEDTLLGFIMDGLTWCSKKYSKKTFTRDCPGSTQCEKNPVRSFWSRTSAAFAEAACGEVKVMLNGSINTPFDTGSIFSTVDIKRFKSPKVKALKIILVITEKDKATCENDSLKKLQGVLDPSLKYTCKEVQRSTIMNCIKNQGSSCDDCW